VLCCVTWNGMAWLVMRWHDLERHVAISSFRFSKQHDPFRPFSFFQTRVHSEQWQTGNDWKAPRVGFIRFICIRHSGSQVFCRQNPGWWSETTFWSENEESFVPCVWKAQTNSGLFSSFRQWKNPGRFGLVGALFEQWENATRKYGWIQPF